jgi:hypothetical protein
MADTFTSHPRTGAKSAIGATALQLTSSPTSCQSGVLIRADKANTGTVYVGPAAVTAGTADATDGFPLAAGDIIFIPVVDASLVFAIGSATGQRVFWMEQ